jgi:hypothetical protein
MKKYSNLLWGLITAGLTITIFLLQVEKRNPVYAVKNEPVLIYDNSISSPKIKLLLEDSVQISSNVYITNLVLWNKGRLTITKEDIRKEITVIPTNRDSITILDYKIVQETHPGISNFNLIEKDNSLFLDWDFFDPMFGLEIQVIYAGANSNNPFIIEGYVEGNQVKKVTKRDKDDFWISIMYYTMLGIMFIFIIWIWTSTIKKGQWKSKWPDLTWITLSFIGMIVIFYFFVLKDTRFGINVPL